MIIFYLKDTGKIIGTIEGRIHGSEQLNQWIGNRDEVDRIIVNWVKNESGKYEPDVSDQEQYDMFVKLDKNPMSIYDYFIDTVSGKLVRKERT